MSPLRFPKINPLVLIGLAGAFLLSALPLFAAKIVTNTNDSGPGSLRQAFADATTGETVLFDASFTGATTQRSIVLASDLVLRRDMYVAGPGSAKLKLVAAAGHRHITMLIDRSLAISNLMLEGPFGAGATGGGVFNQGSLWMAGSVIRRCRSAGQNSGAAIYSIKKLELISCYFEGNEAPGILSTSGGAVVDASGSAWSATEGMRISGCTFRGNKCGLTGGALSVSASGIPLIENSTFFDNWAGRTAGAIFLGGGGVFTHCTITRNTTDGTDFYGFGAGGVHSVGTGGTKLTMRHTILSGNTGPSGDVTSDFGPTTGWNVVGTGTAVDLGSPLALVDGVAGNKVGISDPRLQASPERNSILTPFLMPLADSPAFNAGITPGSPDLAADQTGIARPQGLRSDIGAMEVAALFTVSLPQGTLGQPYSSPTITPSFGTGPFNFEVLEPLPAGLSLNGSTGQLYGTPQSFGTFTLTFGCLAASNGRGYVTAALVIPPPPPIMVTTGDDNGNVNTPLAGSLRAALKVAAGVTASRIAFAPGLTAVGMKAPQCEVPSRVEIDGGTAGVTISRLASAVDDRLCIVRLGGALIVKNLHITGFRHPSQAGAIQVDGSITADGCTFSNNSCAQAAAVEVDGPVTSTLTNCTFTNNSGSEAITFNYSTGQHVMQNCTVVNQTRGAGQFGVGISAGDGFEAHQPILLLRNCLVVNNQDGSLYGILRPGSGHNIVSEFRPGGLLKSQLSPALFGNGGLYGLVNGVDGNIVRPYPGPNLELEPLGNYGGPTPTVAVRPGSQVINAGSSTGAPAIDQRGAARPAGGVFDVGAFESADGLTATPPALAQGLAMPPFQLTAAGVAPHTFSILSGSLPAGLSLSSSGLLSGTPTVVATSVAQLRITSGTGIVAWDTLTIEVQPRRIVRNTLDSGPDSLRDTLASLLPGEVLAFDDVFFATPRTITISSPLTLTRSLTVAGPGKDLLTIQGQIHRLFTYTGTPNSHDVTFTDLTLNFFNSNTSPGGSILNTTGDVTLLRCKVLGINPTSALQGGAFRLTGGNLTLTECLVVGISGAATGGLAWVKDGSVTLTNCEIMQTQTTQKGGIIYQENGALTVTNCALHTTIFTGSEGGAFWHRNGPVTFLNTVLQNCVTNGSSASGGALWHELGAVSLTGCTVEYCSSTGGGGGALRLSSAPLTVTDCYFRFNNTQALGGCIRTDLAAATLTRCSFLDSSADQGGGAVFITGGVLEAVDCGFLSCVATGVSGNGGAILSNSGNVGLTRCAFHDNYSSVLVGAVVMNSGSLTAASCSFTNNRDEAISTSGSSGDAVSLTNCLFHGHARTALRAGPLPVSVVNCTFSNNGNAGGFAGGIFFDTALMLKNCLFSANIGGLGQDYYGGANGTLSASSTNNVFSSTTASLTPVNDQGAALPLPATVPPLTLRVPEVKPIPMRHRALLSGSAGFNAGTAAGAPVVDMLGTPRPQHGGVDVGAVEATLLITSTPPAGRVGSAYGPYFPTVTDTLPGGTPYVFSVGSGSTLPPGLTLNPATGSISGAPTLPGPFTFALVVTAKNGRIGGAQQTITVGGSSLVTNANDSGPGSLRQAMLDAPSGTSIDFAPAFLTEPRVITLATPIVLTKSVTILGPGADKLTINAPAAARAIECFEPNISLSLDGVKFQGNGSMVIWHESVGGALTLRRCWVEAVTPYPSAAVVRAKDCAATITECSFTGATLSYLEILGDSLHAGRSSLVENCLFSEATTQCVTGTLATGAQCVFRHCTFAGPNRALGLTNNAEAVIYQFGNNVFATAGTNIITPVGVQPVSLGGNVYSNGASSPGVFTAADVLYAGEHMTGLANYGGSMPTRMLQMHSPAIDRATTVPAAYDQIGQPRPLRAAADAGSREASPVIVTNLPLVFPAVEALQPGPTLALLAQGGTAPYTFAAISLPAGLSLSAAGVLSGTPTAVGVQPIRVAVTDAAGFVGYALSSLPVAPEALVTTGNDSGAGSLRQVIADAVDHAIIRFASGVTLVNVTSGSINAGAKNLTIEGRAGMVLRGGAFGLETTATSQFTVRDVAFENFTTWPLQIHSAVTLTVERCSFTSCGGAIHASTAAGIIAARDCLFRQISTNHAVVAGAGSFLENCLLTQGTSTNEALLLKGPTTMKSCVIANNSGRAVAFSGFPLLLENCVLTDNINGLWTAPMIAPGSYHNLLRGAGATVFTHGVNSNFILTADQPAPLAPLAQYGGPRLSMVPLSNGAALDAGSASSLTADIRGIARPQGSGVDIGATEATISLSLIAPLDQAQRFQAYSRVLTPASFNISGSEPTSAYTLSLASTLPTGLTWTPASGTLSGTPTVSGTFQLVFVVNSATQGAAVAVPITINRQTVVLNGADSGLGSLRDVLNDSADGDSITFDPAVTEVVITTAAISTARRVSINGGETGVTIRRGASFGRWLDVTAGGSVSLRALTIRNFTVASPLGSAIGATNATLTVDQCLVRDCAATGIAAQASVLYVVNSTFVNITTLGTDDGAIGIFGTLPTSAQIVNCTFRDCDAAISDQMQGTIVINSVVANCSQPFSSGNQNNTTLSPLSRRNVVEVTSGSPGGLVSGVNGNLLTSSARLQGLANNGGPTQTCRLASNSHGVDLADASVAPGQDAAGLPRRGLGPDAGALETRLTVTGYIFSAFTGQVLPPSTFTATGGQAPYVWSASGLPSGLSIHPTTGVVSGTPPSISNTAATITATDANGTSAIWTDLVRVVSSAAPEPEILITGNGQEIYLRNLFALEQNGTHFGEVPVASGSVIRSFLVRNIGSGDLSLTGVNFSSQSSGGDFTFIGQPIYLLPANASTTVLVSFNPSAPGLREAVLTISSTDANEPTTNVVLNGFGTAPELAVSGLGQAIASGDATPSAVDGTLLGTAAISGSAVTQDFVVTASGQGSLHLSGVNFTGTHAADFTATWPTSIASGSSGILRVTSRPTALGLRSATLNLTTDAITSQPFTFAVQSTGVASPALVRGNGNSVTIADGDTTPTTSDHTDFGAVTTGNVAQRTFTIVNQLATPLTLSPISLSGAGAAQYRLLTPPPPTVAGNGNATFIVEYQRFGSGPAPATLSLIINGDSTDPYDFAITAAGAGAAAPTDITLSASTLAENNAPAATVGLFTAVDADADDTLSFSLVSGSGSTDNAAFSLLGNQLLLNAAADFETKSSYALRARVTDAGGLIFEKAFTLTITNVNEAPSFTSGGDRVHPLTTTGAIAVPAWATAMTNGDAPAVQTLSFTTTLISGAGMFTTPPALAANGDLTYTLNGTAGQAVVQVILTDDTSLGGAARSSAPVRFTIAVESAATWLVTLNATTFSVVSPGGTAETMLVSRTGDILTFYTSIAGATFSLNGGAKVTREFNFDLTRLPLTLTTFSVDMGNGVDVLQWNAPLEFSQPVAITLTADDQIYFANARLTSPSTGVITLAANTMMLDPVVSIAAGTAITLRQQTLTQGIRLGEKASSSELSFLPWELDLFTTPLLNIGQTTGGNVSIAAPIAPARAGSTKLLCSPTAGSITARNTGIDFTGPLALSGRMGANYTTSSVLETGYSPLRVAGTINVTGTAFYLTGPYVPNPPETFVVIDNDGTDPIVGTFTGLAEGGTFVHLSRTYRMTYVGGTGNDAVLTVQGPEIAVTGNGVDIVHASTTPTVADFRDFGSVFIGFSVTRTFTVSNIGNSVLTIASQNLFDTGAADYTILTPLPASLAGGASADVTIRFTPSVVGARPLASDIANNDATEPVFRLNMTGTGATPSALALGDVAVTGINGVGNFFTFMPLVDIPAFTTLSFTDLGWKSTNAFSATTTMDGRATWSTPSTIPRGTHLKMTLSTVGRALENLTTGENITSQVTFTGWTTAGTTQLGGTAGDSLIIHQGPATNPFFITGLNNSSDTVLATGWNSLDTPNDSTCRLPSGTGSQNALTNATNALGLAGGTSQRDNSRYNGPVTPADRATWLTRLVTRTNWTGDSTGVFTGTLGTAATVGAGEINVTGSGAFGNVGITTGIVRRDFTIENTTGTGFLLLGTATLTGTHASDFTITSSPPTAIAAGTTATLTVTFNPSALGSRTATLTIPSNDADEPNTIIALSGTGIVDPLPPSIVSTNLTPDGRQQITFTTQVGGVYQVQTNTTLSEISWTTVTTINGTGNPETWISPSNAASRQFVRIVGP